MVGSVDASAVSDHWAAIGVIVALVAQSGAIFVWGGRLWERVEGNTAEIKDLRDWKHDVIAPLVQRHEVEIELLKQRESTG